MKNLEMKNGTSWKKIRMTGIGFLGMRLLSFMGLPGSLGLDGGARGGRDEGIAEWYGSKWQKHLH